MDRSRNDAVGKEEKRLATLDALRSLLKKAANSFDQQEILLSVRGRRERIAPRPEDGFLE